MDTNSKEHVPVGRNVVAGEKVDRATDERVLSCGNVDKTTEEHALMDGNVDRASNEHIPVGDNVTDVHVSSDNIDSFPDGYVPAGENVNRTIDVHDRQEIIADRSIIYESVPIDAGVDIIPEICISTDANVDRAHDEHKHIGESVGEYTDALVPLEAGVDRFQEYSPAVLDLQMLDILRQTSIQQTQSGLKSSKSIKIVNSKNVNISSRIVMSGTLAEESLKIRITEAKKIFVPTASFLEVKRKMEQFGHVTISGASGEGKTTMSLMLASDYMTKGYNVVFVKRVEAFDFDECISSGDRLFLIVDDVFGTVGLSTDIIHLRSLVTSLRSHIIDSRQKTDPSPKSSKGNSPEGKGHGVEKGYEKEDKHHPEEHKDIRVVFTSKTYNLKDGISNMEYERLSMFKGQAVVDLTANKDCCYSTTDRFAIFEKHRSLHQKRKTEDFLKQDISKLDTELFGFPMTCRLFFEFGSLACNAKDFFQQPLFYLKLELSRILSLKNNQSAALILMLLCEGDLDLAKLEQQGRDSTIDRMLKHVTELVPLVTRSEIATAARNFRGTYFSGSDTLRFSHSSISDACAFSLFKISCSFVLQYCSYDFLYERLKPSVVNETGSSDYQHFLFVTENYFDLVATRLVNAMLQCKFAKIVTHPILKNEQFVQCLLGKLQDKVKKDKDARWIHQKDRGKGFLYWAVQGPSSLLVTEAEKLTKFKFTQNDIIEALEGCVEKDKLSVLKILTDRLKQGSDSLILGLFSKRRTKNCFPNKDRLLLQSAETASWEMAEYFLKEGADINARDRNMRNYLHRLCLSGRSDVLEAFITNANILIPEVKVLAINAVDIDERTPIMLAARSGSWECYQLLKRWADIDKEDIHGCKILHLASWGGNMDISKHSLTSFNINSRGRESWTPVMAAAAGGHKVMFDFLVSYNADLTHVDDYGDSVLHLACRGGNRDIVLHALTTSNINSRGKFGWTPVMKAAVHGQKIVFDLLVSYNADLTHVDDYGDSVLHLACQGGNTDIVQHVLSPSNINSRGEHGWTSVMVAAVQGHTHVFDFLVSNNADVTLLDYYGNNLAELACEGGNKDIMKYTLTHRI